MPFVTLGTTNQTLLILKCKELKMKIKLCKHLNLYVTISVSHWVIKTSSQHTYLNTFYFLRNFIQILYS